MEALLVIIAIIIIGCIVVGFILVAAPFLLWGAGVLYSFWPFILGCIIGVPLSLSQNGSGLGNLIVVAGLIGNIFWIKHIRKH